MLKKFTFATSIFIYSVFYLNSLTIDQNDIPHNEEFKYVNKMHHLDRSKLAEGTIVTDVNSELTEYLLLPEKAAQTWTLSLFDFSGKTEPHYHDLQNQLVIVLEGELSVRLDDQEAILLAGQYGAIPKGSVHALASGKEGSRFLVLDMPGFDYPTDRLTGKSLPSLDKKINADVMQSPYFIDKTIQLSNEYLNQLHQTPSLSSSYFLKKIVQEDTITYSIVSPEITDNRWNIALAEFKSNELKPISFNGNQRMIVLKGVLIVEVNGITHELKPGQSMRFSSAASISVRPLENEYTQLLFVNHP